MMNFIEFGTFTRRLIEYMDDDEYRRLQDALQTNPFAGVLIPGMGGVRKVRWSGTGRGKRGGVRVIYYVAVHESAVLMISIYGKNEQDDLGQDQKRAIRKALAHGGY
jgi:mRNA-degrading endonuclease RelE of RelBE toxin-antitoxin system